MSQPSRVTVLVQLEAYANAMSPSQDGKHALKSCWWELTKARQMKSSSMMPVETAFRATDVREEFRAKTRVRISLENHSDGDENVRDFPDLKDEDDEGKQNEINAIAPLNFSLVDAVEEYRKSQRRNTPETSSSVNDQVGLRQRKKTGTNKSDAGETSTDGWVVVNESGDENVSDQVLMKQLDIVDPVELVAGGLPPRELKRAQQEAHKALVGYIQAANAAAILLTSLQGQRGSA